MVKTLIHEETEQVKQAKDVLLEYRGKGLAREIMSQYCAREQKKGRKRLVLTCLAEKLKMYEKMGCCSNGIADSSWGGEQWYEMYCDLK